MTSIRLYFEGDPRLKPGFSQFLKEVHQLGRQNRCELKLVATGGTPVQDYMAGRRSNPEAWNVLLLDSEGPLTLDLPHKKGLREVDKGSVFWMAQLMESWLLADIQALKGYYGRNFNSEAIPKNPDVEGIPKKQVLDALKKATKHTQKGEYHKTAHAPEILASAKPSLVREGAKECARMFSSLLQGISRG